MSITNDAFKPGARLNNNHLDWQTEYQALRQTAGVVRLEAWTQIEVTGRQRVSFLDGLATNQLNRLAPGEGCETFLTDVKGHVLAYLSVLVQADALLLWTTPEQSASLLAHFDYYRIREDVQFHDRSRERVGWIMAGPRATEFLTHWAGELPARPWAHRNAILADVPVRLTCIEPQPAASYWLTCGAEHAAELQSRMRATGIVLCGQQAWQAWRIERGWPLYGADVSAANLPQEVGRTVRAISFTKGCYLGQEVVARLESRGHVNRSLVRLKCETTDVPPAGAELLSDKHVVGQITSAAFAPDLGLTLALGYVRCDSRAQFVRWGDPPRTAGVAER